MKVYIITGEPFPNGMAAVSRIKNYAKAIKDGGIDVEILIYRRTEVYGRVNNTKTIGIYEGIPYKYIPCTTLRNRFRLLRFIHDMYDQRKTATYLKHTLKRGDVLFFYMAGRADLMLHYIHIAHECGAFCVHDLCELPYGTGAETEKVIRMRKFSLTQVFPQLDGVVSISNTLMELVKQYTKPSCLHIKIPILVDFNQFYLADRSTEVQTPYIFHAGTLYQQKDGILGMIEAFGKAVRRIPKPVKFISTGYIENSPHREDIKRLIIQYQLKDKLAFTGYLASDELQDYLSKASCVIINKYRTQQNQYCFSTKLGEYMAAGKPVIITKVGEATNWLEDGKTAYIVEPENTEALADAIVNVLAHPEISCKIGLSGQEFCRHNFDYHNWSKPLSEFLNKINNNIQ